MWPGPVFRVELITTARRARFYLIRVAFVAVLALVFWMNYESIRRYHRFVSTSDQDYTFREMNRFSLQTFLFISVAQFFGVIFLTPALVAGVVAEEKQRKTLQYLLSSRLSGAEIILGKLFARLLHVAVFLALALPMTSLLTVFGGLEPLLVLAVDVVLMSLAYFLGGLSILVSTYGRQARESVALTIPLVLTWLLLPPYIDVLPTATLEWPYDRILEWIKPVNAWVSATNPLALWVGFLRGWPGLWALYEPILWMVGLQLGYGSAFAALAIARLRPLNRNEGARGRLAARFEGWTRGRRFLPRPACGDAPMLWKELYVSRGSGVGKVMMAVLAVAVIALIGVAAWEPIRDAYVELWRDGYRPGPMGRDLGGGRADLNGFLRTLGGLGSGAYLLFVATAAAGGITSEREGDHWTALMSTPMGAREVLPAKLLGAPWGLKWLAVVLVGFWALGLICGAIHPLGFLAGVVELAIFTAFASALGTYVSLVSKTSTKALATTVGLMLFLNGGYLLLLLPLTWDGPLSVASAAGCAPWLTATSLMSFSDVADIRALPTLWPATMDLPSTTYFRDKSLAQTIQGHYIGVFLYLIGTLGLVSMSFARFDRVADRPRRI